MLLLSTINSLVEFIANWPYFVVASGFCSIISVITLRALWKKLFFNNKDFKISKDDSLEIVELLIKNITNNKDAFFIATVQSDDSFDNIEIFPKNIDKLHSFMIHPGKDELLFYLLKKQDNLYLYATLSFREMDFKCIATDKNIPKLKELLALLSKDHIEEPQEFTQKIIDSLKL